MDTKEILSKISDFLEKIGVKEALKKPEVVNAIYDIMSKHGMKVDKTMFSLAVMGFASVPTDKLGDIVSAFAGAAAQGGAGANPLAAVLGALGTAQQGGGQQQGNAAAANPLLNVLGTALAGQAGQAAQASSQAQSAQGGAGANPLAALGALSAIAGALGGTAQQPQSQQQSQKAQGPSAADAINVVADLAKMMSQK